MLGAGRSFGWHHEWGSEVGDDVYRHVCMYVCGIMGWVVMVRDRVSVVVS